MVQKGHIESGYRTFMRNYETRGSLATFAILCAMAILALPDGAAAQSASGRDSRGRGHERSTTRPGVPEFDPSSAGAIAALIAGGAVILARRRSTRR